MALTMNVSGWCTGCGAVYRPPEIEPEYEESPGISETDHNTAALVVPVTVAVYDCVKPAFTVADCGERLMPTGCKVMVTVALAEMLGLLTLVAVTVAVPPGGGEEGAV